MSNAAKFRKRAADFESQKQFDKAIASYVRAIEAGDAEGAEVDVALLNKVGDLTLRLGRVAEAVTSYERAVDHYAAVGLFNNAIALCNKILRHAPGRVGVYLTLGRVCARKGMRGDATRNFLEYAARMQKEGRTDDAMKSLAEVAGLMPELTEVRRLVEEHAARVGIALPAAADVAAHTDELAARKADVLVFLDVDYDAALTPPLGSESFEPIPVTAPTVAAGRGNTPSSTSRTNSLDDLMIFDPSEIEDDIEYAEPLDGFEGNAPEMTPDVDDDVSRTDPQLALVPSPADAARDVRPEVPEGLTDSLGYAPHESHELPAAEVLDGFVAESEDGLLLDVASLDASDIEASAEAAQDVVWLEVDKCDFASDESSDLTADVGDSGLPHAMREVSMELAEVPVVLDFDGMAFRDGVEELLDAEVAEDGEGAETVGVTGDELAEGTDLDPTAGLVVDGESEALSDAWGETAEELAAEAAVAETADAPVDQSWKDAEDAHDDRSATEASREMPRDLDAEVADEAMLVEAGSAESAAELSAELESTTEKHMESIDGLVVEESSGVETSHDAAAESEAEAAAEAESEVEPQAEAEAEDLITEDLVSDDLVIDDLTTEDVVLEDFVIAVDEPIEAGEAFTFDASQTLTEAESFESEVRDADSAVAAALELDADESYEGESEWADAPTLAMADILHESSAATAEPAGYDWRESAPRLDPHDFILPGELPPIIIPDSLLRSRSAHAWVGSDEAPPAEPFEMVVRELSSEPTDEDILDLDTDEFVVGEENQVLDLDAADVLDLDADDVLDLDADELPSAALVDPSPDSSLDLDALLTPQTPAVAMNLALDRCVRLREEADAHPGDWARRRRLAEALLEAGEVESGLSELAAIALGLEVEGEFEQAARVSDDIVRVAPDAIAHHLKRVELAVRLGDRDRLRESYLDMADALVRTGMGSRAESVYVRVLELDPWDDRARTALGDAAPPAPARPPQVAPADDGYVNLADWLSDDSGQPDTRMRLREPTVTGDENADFDRLLQHFREGVARSLGDDDYESHYDLGVAYKEMGLLDDAIAEFQRALRSPTHRLPAYEALGQCFLEQGSFPVAVTVLSRALHEPGLDDEQRVGVLYLLGYACEALQRRDEARSYFQRVYATDINFRDVADRLAALDRGV